MQTLVHQLKAHELCFSFRTQSLCSISLASWVSIWFPIEDAGETLSLALVLTLLGQNSPRSVVIIDWDDPFFGLLDGFLMGSLFSVTSPCIESSYVWGCSWSPCSVILLYMNFFDLKNDLLLCRSWYWNLSCTTRRRSGRPWAKFPASQVRTRESKYNRKKNGDS